jgi:hypothetical protein
VAGDDSGAPDDILEAAADAAAAAERGEGTRLNHGIRVHPSGGGGGGDEQYSNHDDHDYVDAAHIHHLKVTLNPKFQTPNLQLKPLTLNLEP